MIIKSRAKLVEGFKSVIDNGRAHSVVTDLPEKLGGTDKGPTALELAVMGLAGCISTIFTLVAKKMKVQVEALEVEVEAEKPDTAATITSATVITKVKSPADEETIKKVYELTLKNCPVGVLFEKAGVKVTHKVEKIS